MYQDIIFSRYPEFINCVTFTVPVTILDTFDNVMGNRSNFSAGDVVKLLPYPECLFEICHNDTPLVAFCMLNKLHNDNLGQSYILYDKRSNKTTVINNFEDKVSMLRSWVMKVLTLLNCKNIATENVLPSRPLRRRCERSGLSKESLIYKILKIRLSKGKEIKYWSGYRINPNNNQRAHLVRGHFKTYTEDKPLMGKYIGTWFWPPHLAGNREKGVVLKDYEVVG